MKLREHLLSRHDYTSKILTKDCKWIDGAVAYFSSVSGGNVCEKHVKGEIEITYGLGEVGYQPHLLYPKFNKVSKTPTVNDGFAVIQRQLTTAEVIELEQSLEPDELVRRIEQGELNISE